MWMLAALAIQTDGLPPIPREFRAAWVATVDNIDWPTKPGLTAEVQRREMVAILDMATRLKLNAIVYQIRPAADAFYESKLEPWSAYLTGQQGQSPGYDPLKFTLEEAHKRGIEVHVWFNPYRAKHPSAKGDLAPNHVGRTHPSIVYPYGKLLWMDPGAAFTRQRSLSVVLDVVRRYDIDGVHIDDYFYPYPEKGEEFPDRHSFALYQGSGGKLSKADWRRKNVDDFVHDFYFGVKNVKPWVKVGISPFGIYRPGVPAGIKAGIDQYAELYADPLKWLHQGWCDYMAPQLYWPIDQAPQSYPVLLNWWLTQNPRERHIWPGNFTSRTDPSGGNWKAQEVVNQIIQTRRRGAGGNIHFSMKALMANWNGITRSLETGPYASVAAVPASLWLPGDALAAPEPKRSGKTVEWQAVKDAHLYGIAEQRGQVWTWVKFQPGLSFVVQSPEVTGVQVVALGRNGVAGPAGSAIWGPNLP
ncbi:MAG: glycoside hydrolase family 10 protein [Fimbriimonas sp.]